MKDLKEMSATLGKQLLSIILTGLVAGGIAMLQQAMSQYGVDCGPVLDTGNTATIGMGLRTAVASVQIYKSAA